MKGKGQDHWFSPNHSEYNFQSLILGSYQGKIHNFLISGFEAGVEPSPETGKNRGLTLIIDAHSDIASPSTVRDDFEGFLALVNSPKTFPSLFEKG